MSPRIPRPCLSCGTPTRNTTRCNRCGGDRTPTRQGYGNAERTRRAAVVQQWRAQHGDVCPGWQRPAHAVSPPNKLTADHVRAVARGGSQQGALQVLCLRCNGAKGASR
jgi:5-methylcytosine-specific restriction protein A